MEHFVKEPRVSVVVVNWNYARFVGDAIRSVMAQSYKNFQCIVIDNGSDDGSAEHILDAIDKHPQFAFYRLPSNLGQLGAALLSLKHITGDFVTFLDADDVLLPHYLASHLQAHLAAEFSVGFTSSNCVDVNAEGALLTGGNFWMYQRWRQGQPALRPIERTVRLTALDETAYSALAEASRYIPAHTPSWSWCPGSSNMFRRALLDRVRPADSSQAMFGSLDGFFTPILHALTGTLLIDRPLSAYRVHSANYCTALPSLTGINCVRPQFEPQGSATFSRVMISLVDRIDDIMAIATPPSRYWRIVETIMTMGPSRNEFSRPEINAALVRRYPRLVELFGARQVYSELRRYMRFPDFLKVMLAGRKREFPAAEFCRALSWEIVRAMRRLARKILSVPRIIVTSLNRPPS
jgi:glycosyltransferase involved in cell wall biosynthesis